MSKEIIPISLEDEYKKDTGITPEDIRKLRQWLETQPHLPRDYITDLDLILTYHSCDCSAEVAKQVLDLHYTLRTLFTSFFKDRAVDADLERVFEVVVMYMLPMQARDGSAVLYGRLVDFEPKNFDFCKVMKTVVMLVDLLAYEQGTWSGFHLIFDLHGLRLGHLARLDMQTMQQFLYYLQEAMLVRVRGLHFINAPSFMDKLMMLIKPFLKRELLEKLAIHPIGSKTIDDHVPLQALNKEAGGEGPSIPEITKFMLEKMRANREFFELENKKRVVEAKRPGKPKTISDIFGSVEGSFKKLDID